MLIAPAAFAQDQAMTGEQVKAALVGKKVFGRSTSGGLVDFYMRADGTSEVAVGNLRDTGVWRITDNGYCNTWKTIRGGREGCFTVVKRGDKITILNSDGSVGTEILRIVD
jgi:hypothetical protein